ncbi:MAG: hypothetical protein WBW48_07150 [Anaerolineae bacterium]
MLDFHAYSEFTQTTYRKVRDLFRAEVVVRFGEVDIGANETMISRVENGIPTIILKHGTILTEDCFCHELYHLLMKGVSGYHFLQATGYFLAELKRKYHNPPMIVGKCHSILQHSFFFPKMIEAGFSPTSYLLEQMDQQKQTYPSCYSNKDRKANVIMDAWHIMLGRSDSKIDSTVYVNFFAEGFGPYFEKAKTIAEILRYFDDPVDEPNFFCRVLSILSDIRNIHYSVQGKTVVYH